MLAPWSQPGTRTTGISPVPSCAGTSLHWNGPGCSLHRSLPEAGATGASLELVWAWSLSLRGQPRFGSSGACLHWSSPGAWAHGSWPVIYVPGGWTGAEWAGDLGPWEASLVKVK